MGIRRALKGQKPRRGVMRFTVTHWETKTAVVTVEVEEIEKVNEFSRLKIKSISGLKNKSQKSIIQLELDGLVESSRVSWFKDDR